MFADGGASGQFNFSARIDSEDFNENLFAFFEDIGDVIDVSVGEFGDMDHAVGAGEDFDESAEVHNFFDGTEVDVPDFSLAGDTVDHVDSFLQADAVVCGDLDGAVVLDIDLCAGGSADVSDRFSACADDFANFFGFNPDGFDLRREFAFFVAGAVDGGEHTSEDMFSSLVSLFEGLSHDIAGDAGDFDIHLDGGDAVFGAADFEVHVAQVVFIAEDVGEDGNFVAFFNESHSDAGDGGFNFESCVHSGECSAADGSHGA